MRRLPSQPLIRVHSWLLCLWIVLAFVPLAAAQDVVRIGTKNDTETPILGHVMAILARDAGAPADVQLVGGSGLIWTALTGGQIDAYVDYTGTLRGDALSTLNLKTTRNSAPPSRNRASA